MQQRHDFLNCSCLTQLFIFFVFTIVISISAYSDVIAQGVEYTYERWNNSDVHILIVDLTKATVEPVIPSKSSYGLYSVAQIANEINRRQDPSHNRRIVAGVNGGFFECLRNCDCTLPECIKNLSKIVTRDNVYHDVQLHHDDPRWSFASMRSELRIYSGSSVQIARPQDMPGPSNYTILGGAGYLLPKGNLLSSIPDENPPDANFPRARTAVGYSSSNQLWIVTVSEQGTSQGMTLAGLSDYLAFKGLIRGLALDGGSSSQMWVKGIASSTSGVVMSGRKILSALVVWSEPIPAAVPSGIVPPIAPRGNGDRPWRFPTVPNLPNWCGFGQRVARHLSRGETSLEHWNKIVNHVMVWENTRAPGVLAAFQTGLNGGDCSIYTSAFSESEQQ